MRDSLFEFQYKYSQDCLGHRPAWLGCPLLASEVLNSLRCFFHKHERCENCKIETPFLVHNDSHTFSFAGWCRFVEVSRVTVWTCVWDIFTKGKCEVRECSTFWRAVVYVVHSIRLLLLFAHGHCSYHVFIIWFFCPDHPLFIFCI